MARDYVCLYHSYLDAIQALGDAERGRLFTAMLEYSLTGAAGHLSGNERFLFPLVKAQIDRDKEKYTRQCEKNAINGKSGGRPKKPKNPVGFFENEKSQGKGKGERKDKGENIPLSSPLGERFERFWAAYPRKVGKAAAFKAFQKVRPEEALLEQMLETIRREKGSLQWQEEGGRFIPHPATWLNQGRWEDEPLEAAEADPYGGETL